MVFIKCLYFFVVVDGKIIVIIFRIDIILLV